MIGLIPPPDRCGRYVLQGMPTTAGRISYVFTGGIPVMLVYILDIVILMVFPAIAL